jgi:hypothetical protein
MRIEDVEMDDGNPQKLARLCMRSAFAGAGPKSRLRPAVRQLKERLIPDQGSQNYQLINTA